MGKMLTRCCMRRTMIPLAVTAIVLLLLQPLLYMIEGNEGGNVALAALRFHLLGVVAIAAAVVAVKGGFPDESKVKPQAFALAGMAVLLYIFYFLGLFRTGLWAPVPIEFAGLEIYGLIWLIELAMVGHASALLMLTRVALASTGEAGAALSFQSPPVQQQYAQPQPQPQPATASSPQLSPNPTINVNIQNVQPNTGEKNIHIQDSVVTDSDLL